MFIDRSDLLVANPPMLGYGVCVFAAEGDGTFSFFVAGFGYPNRRLRWDGERLVDIFDPVLAAAERRAIGVAAGDIDGDGLEELYVLNTDTFRGRKQYGDQLFAFRGDAWHDLFALAQNERAVNQYAGRSVCAVDRLGRGRYGFFVANYGGPMRLYECGENDSLTDAGSEAGIALVTGGRSLISLPLVSSEGRMDVFAANENGPNFLFVNGGEGKFTESAAAFGLTDAYSHGRGIAVLDADGDGRFDLVVGNWQDEHRLFVQGAEGQFVNAATPEMSRPSAVRTVIAADFDNDGYEEIFFNNLGEPNRLFGWRDGAWVRLPLGDALETGGLGTGAAVADLDGDGRLELLVSHGESDAQPLSLYQTAPNANHYLRVLPLTRSLAPARGAVVTLTAAGRRQMQAIDAGSGYLCQMEPVAHFGLGENAAVERVEVLWPTGSRVIIERPDADQTLRISHPN